jgi:drug/metabolite transporter (DMT)-like permease
MGDKVVKLQSRWRSKASWITLLSSVGIILGYFCTRETVTIVEGIGAAILVAAEAFGVFNNPTSKNTF